jgi:putative transposase
VLCLAKTSSGGPRPRKPGSPSAIVSSARATTSPSIDSPAQDVLGCVENALVRVDQASHLGHSSNRRELASSGVSFVLDVGLSSQPDRGRKRVSKEVRALIFRMVSENPTWGAPRIHGELVKLGVDLAERSVSRWIRRAPRDPDSAKRWLTFLRNHREAIAAMDFFTVPTLTFGVVYCFFVIRRKILHFNVTRNPNALWVVQQLREAWAYKQPHRFLLFDRDAKFGADVVSAVRDMGSEPTRTAFRSPWQNGVAERWVGSCRRDLLDHVIILNERHLKRLMSSYVLYYHEDRTHLGLAKDTPAGRPTAIRSEAENKILSFPRLGGLHYRYAVAA